MPRPLLARTLSPRIAGILRKGGVGIIPTDTLYGIVASALDPRAVARIYRLRRRNPKKPSIVLIGDPGDLISFGVRPTAAQKKVLGKLWPGKFSIVFKVRTSRYLDRGTGTLAFRLPASTALRRFLHIAGPIIAPSANFEGEPPALTVKEAKRYFGDKVDFYVGAGRENGKPSTVVTFKDGRLKVLRPGAGRLPKSLEYVNLL